MKCVIYITQSSKWHDYFYFHVSNLNHWFKSIKPNITMCLRSKILAQKQQIKCRYATSCTAAIVKTNDPVLLKCQVARSAKIIFHWNVKQPTTLTSGLIQAVCKKTGGLHVPLCRNISAPVQFTDLVEVSKEKSCSLHSKNFLLAGCGFFVTDVITGGLFGHHHLALGANR